MNNDSHLLTNDSIDKEDLKSLGDFIDIGQIIQDAYSYSLWSQLQKQDIHSLVQSRLGFIEKKDIIPVIVAAIIDKQKIEFLTTKNIALQLEVSRLTHKVINMEKEIDIFNAHEWTLEIWTDWTILSVNDFMLQSSGYTREELIGKNMHIMSSWVHSQKFWSNFWTTIKAWRVWAGDICNKRKDGSIVWLWTLVLPQGNAVGDIIQFKVVRQEISESNLLKKHFENRIIEQKTDPLTWLFNRVKCLEDFSEEKNRNITLLHINNMFEINHILWRDTWDKIIKRIGKILSNFSKKYNTNVYRFEWVDFCIVFNWDIDESFIQSKFNGLEDLEIYENGKRIQLSFSLGVVFQEQNINEAIKNGYVALKESKKTKTYVIFDKENLSSKKSADFFVIRNLIREAFKEDLFTVVFQEIVENSCSTKKTSQRKFECLVRMRTRENAERLIPPNVFLWAIKKDGKNRMLTECIIDKICLFMQKTEGIFSINLTEDDLQFSDFAKMIYTKIVNYGIKPERIIFEILEEIENIESENVLENIQSLKNLGFNIAIDDFGSGYSNFSRILDFEPTFLKIDMKYIRWIDTNPKNRSLVRAIVGFAHDNGMAIVGEGVETKEEQLVLESLWVDYSQGYLFGKPSPTLSTKTPY